MKMTRQAKIRELIDREKIQTQEGLAEALRREGIKVTQATVSRDIKELMLVKVPDAGGGYHYAYPKDKDALLTQGRLERTFQDAVLSVHATEALAIVHTLPGAAQSVAYALDCLKWPEVLGSIAGDDTVFVAAADRAGVAAIVERFQEHI